MQKQTLITVLICQILCLGFLFIWSLSDNKMGIVHAQGTTPTPEPFLGPIFYNQEAVWQIFDHDLPLGGGPQDGNDHVIHYDGVLYPAVTATAVPGATPSPTSTPNPPYIPNAGYGYDQHGGIDYSMEYEPVLAAASGSVQYAGWNNPSNHRSGYGLYVILDHTSETLYDTWYGHLSVVTVHTGQGITVDPDDPGNRLHIIGVSGNTGSVFGSGGSCSVIPTGGPTCGQHLHFEVRLDDAGYKPVNPYGWIGGTGTPDPWASPTPPTPPGAVSYYLWATRPAISSSQYGTSGPTVTAPPLEDASLVIDDDSADFVTPTPGSCWSAQAHASAHNNSYHQAEAIPSPTPSATPTPVVCSAAWQVEPDAFSPPGAYDIYVHIPDVDQASLDAEYRIHHDGEEHTARIVQLVYPNEEHPEAWAYIGRHEFAMDGSVEKIELTNETLLTDDDNENRYVLADTIKLLPVEPLVPPAYELYFSWANNGTIGDFVYKQEDIVIYHVLSDTWSVFFDGSDVGLVNVNVDAFIILADGSILLSIDEPLEELGELEKVDDADIVRFIPTSTGPNTAGSFELYFDGSNYSLDDPESGPDNDIDAIGFAPTSELLISTTNSFNEPLIGNFDDEDLVYWDTSGIVPAWVIYFDGSDVGLSTSDEDVNGVWIDEDGQIFLTTNGSFDVSTVQGDGADLFVCDPSSAGSTTACTYSDPLYWNGSAHGNSPLADSGPPPPLVLDGFQIKRSYGSPSCGDEPLNCSFEEGLEDWTIENNPYPNNANWVSTDIDAYTGQYSAMLYATNSPTGSPKLLSSIVLVEPTTGYRLSFFYKFGDCCVGFTTGVNFFLGNNEVLVEEYQTVRSPQSEWIKDGGGDFFCPPTGVIGLQMYIFLNQVFSFPTYMLIDEVAFELQPNMCS